MYRNIAGAKRKVKMADESILKKLMITGGQKIAVVDPPTGYMDKLMPLPAGTEMTEKVAPPLDLVQVFATQSTELENHIPVAVKALKPGGLLWVCFLKGGPRAKTDLNRDVLRKEMEKYGQASVSLVSLDGDWSAMRFKPMEKVGK
jgi:hypothetical protein